MPTTGMPSGQRTRTKTPDLSGMFRSGHGSRHSPALVPAAAVPSPSGVSPDKPAIHKPRRSMLPFLGRKKPTEESRGPATAYSRKSSSGPIPVNTVRRSFGNGHSVLMITPSANASSIDRPPPSILPPLTVSPPSLGSKFAAHFTPLRSPSKNLKSHHSTSQKPVTSPSTSSPVALLPPNTDARAPSFESQRSSMQSRSTTPRPLRPHHAPVKEEGEDEDFSDLFTLPQSKKAAHSSKGASFPLNHTINTAVGPTAKGTEEDSPASPTPPSSLCLQFPIPPSTIRHAPITTTERIRYSSESYTQEGVSVSSSSNVSLPKALHSPRGMTDTESSQVTSDEYRSRDEHNNRRRVASHSGSDTDASRSSARSSKSKPSHVLPKVSTLKNPAPYQSTPAKPPNGPPPSAPLPSPPLSTPPSVGTANNSLPPSANSVISSRLSGTSPRPRANTLSVPSAYNTGHNHNTSSAPQTFSEITKTSTKLMADASADQIREALALQRRKYAHLQEYIVTITKRYEEDRVALTKTIEKLERDIRKKTREIEGLRWLVIHNGGVGDIDAAASLARSSLSTQDNGDDNPEAARPLPSNVKRSKTSTKTFAPSSETQTVSGQKGLGIDLRHDRQSSSTLEIPADYTVNSATSSQSSLSLQAATPPTTGSLSAIPEQLHTSIDISRAERQKAKEERRAARALRRISASSVSALSSGTKVMTELLNPDGSFDPEQSMDDVLEKLRPFANT